MRFDHGDAVCMPWLASSRQFAACLENALRVVQRRYAAFPGQWEPHLYACHTPSWFHVVR